MMLLVCCTSAALDVSKDGEASQCQPSKLKNNNNHIGDGLGMLCIALVFLYACGYSTNMDSSHTIPGGDVTVDVSFICNAYLSDIPWSRFTTPHIRGLNKLDKVPSFAFLVRHPSGKCVLFDMGVRKDWQNLSHSMVRRIKEAGWTADVDKDVPTILEENGVPLQSIDAVVWSHWHWDHVGNMSMLPPSTELIVGPGFSNAMMPGFPTNEHSPILESDYSGRNLIEITDFTTTVAGFPSFDLFGDASFYLLHTPGHAVGHLSALARTTLRNNEVGETFILMGGDCCHHMGQLRPSAQSPLPCDVELVTSPGRPISKHEEEAWMTVCRSKGTRTPFTKISDFPNGASAAHNAVDAITTLQNLQKLDVEDGHIFFAISHDKTLLDVIDTFPCPANEWKRKGWAEGSRWSFLKDLEQNEIHQK